MQLEELVRRIRRGDKAAVKDLVSIYGNAVYLRAFERTQDKELAREAARQVFGQFVSIVQQRPDEDGWSFWFGDLIERNISAYAQIGDDMNYIEDELERELYGEESIQPPEQPNNVQRAVNAPPQAQPRAYDPREDRAAEAEAKAQQQGTKRDKAARSSGRSSRDEIFDEAFAPRKKKRSSHILTVILLVIVCILLLWVVAGVAMTMKWIPYYNLGYTWFNAHVFRLF